MLPIDPDDAVDRLKRFQAAVRDALVRSRDAQGLSAVNRASAADTIYQIDALVDPLIVDFCTDWGHATPLVLIAEGMEDENGVEGARVFPEGSRIDDAQIRLIIDPIDGTRGIMYDKRPAWALAGVAPNNGPATCLRDIELAVMTELPTSKMGQADVLSAIKGRGVHAARVDLATGVARTLSLRPSQAVDLRHGFASIVNFFPGTKAVAGGVMERLARELLGTIDVTKALVFDDQYISTGGQFYELIVGHDRFVADLRPLFYRIQSQPPGLCCHPYDCAAMLIAEEAGVVITDETGQMLNGPLDCTTGLNWIAYANEGLRQAIAPVLKHILETIP